MSQPIATTAAEPSTTSSTERPRFGPSRVTTESTVPRIGVISGATIIAPITVAVESASTPAVAMIEARIRSVQKRLSLRPRSGPSNSRSRRIRPRSASVIESIR